MRPQTVVFVEPPYVCWDRRMDRVREGEEDIPGIGTLVLAAVTRAAGHRVHVVDGKRSGTPLDEVVRRVVALEPDHVGFSATTISIHNAARIAARVKALVPGAVTTVGGPHVSAVPSETLARFAGFDYGVVGEGERSYPELIACLAAREDPGGVAGLVYREGGAVRANPRAPYLDGDALDRLPEPAWDLVPDFPLRLQPNVFNYRASPVASLVTSRGCPFSCSFCDRSTSGRKGRFHGVDYVVGLCRRLADLGVRHILFYDDLFTVSRRRVVELCERFLAEGFRFTWSCNSHPNLLDPPTLRLMRRAGSAPSCSSAGSAAPTAPSTHAPTSSGASPRPSPVSRASSAPWPATSASASAGGSRSTREAAPRPRSCTERAPRRRRRPRPRLPCRGHRWRRRRRRAALLRPGGRDRRRLGRRDGGTRRGGGRRGAPPRGQRRQGGGAPDGPPRAARLRGPARPHARRGRAAPARADPRAAGRLRRVAAGDRRRRAAQGRA